jgi:nucleotide-binding universal stress UspA family protein
MSTGAVVGIAIGAILLGIAVGYWLPPSGRRAARNRPRPVRRILLPFTGQAISRRSFEAAVRLAKAENATIMPAFLAQVPMNLPLDTALPVQCAKGMPLLEAIEQRVASQGLPVESRVSRGRSARDALRRLLEQEQFDRIIVSADEDPRAGLSYEDLRWLLERVPAEILILRPAPEDTRRISAPALNATPDGLAATGARAAT